MKNYHIEYIEDTRPDELGKSVAVLIREQLGEDIDIIDVKYITYSNTQGSVRFGAFIHYRI